MPAGQPYQQQIKRLLLSKTILITGSSRGIGAAIARLAKNDGYEVILHGHNMSANLKLISQELDATHVVFDVNNEDEIQHALKKIRKIDVLVNSAGLNISKPFAGLTNSDWNSIYDTNVFGVVKVIRRVLPIMKKTTSLGRIINIASVKGTYSAVGRVAYASSKAAVINLTTGLAKELAPEVLVNCISPGFTDTEMTHGTWSDRIKQQVNSILLGRMATAEEIANVVLFLSSDRCTYITGQNINIDGGFGIKHD
ncbi:MAG: SDR family oxidoreductase [Candidatus Marinimicrobia bacterium]|nr:SDR family oxidoreductase [Candidatus Neomarinimicrobiota bacterium]